MKRLRQILLTSVIMTFAASSAFAVTSFTKSEEGNIQSYAHPTLFTDASVYSSNNGTYMVGGQIQKTDSFLGFKNKSNVFAEAWSKNILKLIEDSSAKATGGEFNPKLPVLRSELAVILAEGFNLSLPNNLKQYSDVSNDYWAADWIYKALGSGLMIGYPSNQFKPDQPVTKAEVFAVLAQIIDVPYTADGAAPIYKGAEIKYIPKWAYNCTKEVVASNVLPYVSDQNRIINDEYLSKEQVAELVGYLIDSVKYSKEIGISQDAPDAIKNRQSYTLKMKMLDRVDARHSTMGDTFSARLTQAVDIDGVTFPEGSIVKGEVTQVQRPGLSDNGGFIKVKFTEIKNGSTKAKLPVEISDAEATCLTAWTGSPNILARTAGAPLTAAGRILGVAGRGIGEIVDVSGNRVEELGDNLSNVLVETLTLHPGSGIKSFGGSVATVGKGVYDYAKIVTSGVFGMVYELGDEVVYLAYPAASNSSALNPNEQIEVRF